MDKPKTPHQFEQRFLDHRESKLREQARGLPKSRFNSLKKRYATMVLGASLAAAGLGLPMKLGSTNGARLPIKKTEMTTSLTADLKTAQSIARQVTGGIQEAIASPLAPLKEIEKVGEDLALVTEQVKEDFFKKEIPFGSLIYKEAKKNNLRPELVAAVCKTESRFKPNAKSPVGAQGLMQLMPRTGRWMGAKNLYDPAQSIQAGAKYLKYLQERFDGNETKMIAAYNAGEGNVRRFGGIPPFQETRNYVQKVSSSASEYEEQIASMVAESSVESSGTAESGEAVMR